MNERKIEWDVAEVLEYDYTYQYITEDKPDTTVDRLFALRVRSCISFYNNKVFLAKP